MAREETLNCKELRELDIFLGDSASILNQKVTNEKELFRMASHAAHDICSPLSVLSILAGEVEEFLDPRQQRVYRNAVTRIKVIADDLLAVEDVSKRRTSLSPELSGYYLYLGAIFDVVMQEKTVQYMGSPIDIKASISPNAWFVLGKISAGEFHRVLSNLINNAIEVSVGQQQVTVECSIEERSNEQMSYISVKDFGYGMPESQVNAILLGKSKTTKRQGCGIGLQYVIQKIRQWGGSCRIVSQQGVGTDFQLILPVVSPLPSWWVDRIVIPRAGEVIIFDDDEIYHQQFISKG